MSDNPRPDEMPSEPTDPVQPSQPAQPTAPPSEAPMPGGDVDIPAPGSVGFDVGALSDTPRQ
ncbi:MAG: hypothetical protein M3Q57_00115 [Pseudomonadota bacterium]|nr:hypothetical protein [Pseudomonadota bacterium]